MTKISLCLVSLVAAVPGAFLAYVMVMSFLSFGERSPGAFKAIAGMALLLGTLLALMPVGIFLFAGPKTEKKKPDEKEKESDGETSGSESIAEDVDAVEASDSAAEGVEDGDLEVSEEAEPSGFEQESFEDVEGDEEVVEEVAASDDDAWEEPSETMEMPEVEDEVIDFDEDFEPEEKPAKSKKKGKP